MITLSREEALSVLVVLSRLEGFLVSVDEARKTGIFEEFSPPVKLLTAKLNEEPGVK